MISIDLPTISSDFGFTFRDLVLKLTGFVSPYTGLNLFFIAVRIYTVVVIRTF